jgi:lipopolysaccharide/colanic/teichoic acid biosynthesis glycosyltransferase
MLVERADFAAGAVAVPRSAAGSGAYRIVKRATDLIVAVVGLPIALTVVALLSLGVVIESPSWPIYRQWRVGRNGKPFRIWKLRTMVPGADRVGPELTQAADPRVTGVGRWLRRWSLDELPQIANVLLGHMSLVGPRPELPSIVARYNARQAEVLMVKPGLTGWSQVNGRDDLSIPEKLELDREYVYGRSFLGDLWILVRTVPTVWSGRGVKW